jgi:hypothetical protein
LFTRASNVGAFEEHLVLLNLIMDIVSNILSIHKNGGKINGKWYHANTIKLFEVLQKMMHIYLKSKRKENLETS